VAAEVEVVKRRHALTRTKLTRILLWFYKFSTGFGLFSEHLRLRFVLYRPFVSTNQSLIKHRKSASLSVAYLHVEVLSKYEHVCMYVRERALEI
jgi:hypothetical protein